VTTEGSKKPCNGVASYECLWIYHAAISSWMDTISRCLVVTSQGDDGSEMLVSGYAHVFIRLSVVIAPRTRDRPQFLKRFRSNAIAMGQRLLRTDCFLFSVRFRTRRVGRPLMHINRISAHRALSN